MSRSEKLIVIMLRAIMLCATKVNGVLTNAVTIKAYRRIVKAFCKWAADSFGIKRENDIGRMGYSKATLIQEYCDYLVAKCLRAATIHTYIAAVCKGLGVCMSQIQKPTRATTKKTKGLESTGAAHEPKTSREEDLLWLARTVGIRATAFSKLTINNLVVDENGDHLIAQNDKAGKLSGQLIFDHEVNRVMRILSTNAEGEPLKPGERPFTKKDLAHISFMDCRNQRAQSIERHFDRMFNAWEGMSSKTPADRQEREAARQKAEAERRIWIEKLVGKFAAAHPNSPDAVAKFRAELENPSQHALRGTNRQIAKAIGRPDAYDRVSLKIASEYALSHWEDDSTIRNYLTKKVSSDCDFKLDENS